MPMGEGKILCEKRFRALKPAWLVSLTVELVVDHVGDDGADDIVDGEMRADERTRVSFPTLHLVENATRLNTRKGLGDELDVRQRDRVGDAKLLIVLPRPG